jgi:hypothetical protein
MINVDVLRGTWRSRRADIARLCDAIDAAEAPAVPGLERAMFALLDEVEHLRMLLREAEGDAYLRP